MTFLDYCSMEQRGKHLNMLDKFDRFQELHFFDSDEMEAFFMRDNQERVCFSCIFKIMFSYHLLN